MNSWIKYVLKLLISLLMVGFFVRHVDWRNILALLASTRVDFLLMAVFLLSLNILVAALRWYWLVQPLQANSSFMAIMRLRLIADFFNVCLPGGFAGDVVRGVQTKRFGISLSESFSSVFTDRLLGMFGLVVISVLGILFSWNFLLQTGFMIYLLSFSSSFLLFSILLYSRRIRTLFSSIFPLFGNPGRKIGRFHEAIQLYRNFPNVLVPVFAVTILGHLFMIISIYLLALSLGASVAFIYFLLFVPVIGILSMIPVTVNGLGLREAGYVLLFPLVGMSQAQALGVSLLFFVIVVARSLIGGIIYLLPEKIHIPNGQINKEVHD